MFKNTVYHLLQFYVKLALHFYYKRYRRRQEIKISKGPVIFVSNHQNAFLDALILSCATNRNPYFLARASVFKKSWAASLLSVIRIIPIYRISDGFTNVKKNDQIIDRCVKLLSSGGSLLIFPEGNHDNRYHLRTLQKGAARIAFETEKRNEFKLNLKIVPVGIQHEDYHKIGSSVLVSFGFPKAMRDYEVQDQADPATALQNLTADIRNGILPLMVDISPEDQYELIREKWTKLRSKDGDLSIRLK